MTRPASASWRWHTIVTALLVPLLVLSTSGCATMFNPAFQEVPVASTPEGAEVWIDGELVGVTPVIVRLRANVDHEVIVRLAEDEAIWTLERQRSEAGNTGLGGDIFILLPGGLVSAGLIAVGSAPGCAALFDRSCVGLIAAGAAATALTITPLVVDLATNQFYELVPQEITAEFE